MLANHPLARYRQRAALYLRRALATRDPVLRRALFGVASLFQEKASRREDRLAARPGAPKRLAAAAQEELPGVPHDNRLSRYQIRTAEYWRRALATRDPVLQAVLAALAGAFQEVSSRRENYLAKRRAASEPVGAARERRRHAMMARTSSVRHRRAKPGA